MHYSISWKTRSKLKQNCQSYARFRQPEVRDLTVGIKSHPIRSLFWPRTVQLDMKLWSEGNLKRQFTYLAWHLMRLA